MDVQPCLEEMIMYRLLVVLLVVVVCCSAAWCTDKYDEPRKCGYISLRPEKPDKIVPFVNLKSDEPFIVGKGIKIELLTWGSSWQTSIPDNQDIAGGTYDFEIAPVNGVIQSLTKANGVLSLNVRSNVPVAKITITIVERRDGKDVSRKWSRDFIFHFLGFARVGGYRPLKDISPLNL